MPEPDLLLQFLQSLGLSVGTIARISAWWVLVQLAAKPAEKLLQRFLTWFIDRADDLAKSPKDGAMLLAVVDHRAYRVVAFLVRWLCRVILPTRESILARWAKIEQEAESENEKDTHPNLDGTGLHAFALLCCLSALLFTGCATLDPGADPFVVRVEQASTIAKGTFDLVLHTDHSARAFWKEKAPAFHDFCESLREPTQIDGLTLPRCSAALWSLGQVKRDYQAAAPPDKAGARDRVEQSLAALASLTTQANAWLVIVTNQPATLSR